MPKVSNRSPPFRCHCNCALTITNLKELKLEEQRCGEVKAVFDHTVAQFQEKVAQVEGTLADVEQLSACLKSTVGDLRETIRQREEELETERQEKQQLIERQQFYDEETRKGHDKMISREAGLIKQLADPDLAAATRQVAVLTEERDAFREKVEKMTAEMSRVAQFVEPRVASTLKRIEELTAERDKLRVELTKAASAVRVSTPKKQAETPPVAMSPQMAVTFSPQQARVKKASQIPKPKAPLHVKQQMSALTQVQHKASRTPIPLDKENASPATGTTAI